MKTLTRISVILFLFGTLFSSCEKIKSLADVKFDSELNADLNVNIPNYDVKSAILEGFEFSESVTVDPRSDSEIDKYFDKLKSFAVQKVTGTVKSVSAPVKIIIGTISITSGTTVASWTITDFNVETGAQIVLDNGAGQWDKVNKILDGKSEFTAKIEGTADTSGVTFVLNVVINVRVTANPL